MSEQAGRYQRSFSGMVGAMVVLVVVVLAWVGFRALTRGDVADPVRAVDYVTAAEFAREQAAFSVQAPSQLPEGWIATSVRFDPSEDPEDQSWHLGMLTAEQEYVGLEQAARSVAFMVEKHVDQAARTGETVEVDGAVWESFTDAGGDTALVRRAEGVTTLVVGPVDVAVLETLLSTLQGAAQGSGS